MLHNLMKTDRRPFATVITRTGAQDRLPDFPWLEPAYGIDESNWIILSEDGWQSIVDGEPSVWHAFERKLLISFYINQPSLIAIIGHPAGQTDLEAVARGQDDVERLVRRVRACGLPISVLGFWADEDGEFEELIEPGHALCEVDEGEVVA